jgi:3-phenylpropionate/trans-cinnamate dioxygenase ferredoxin subunit
MQGFRSRTGGVVTAYPVCLRSELPPGERRIIDADGISIGVFNVGGRYYALHNRCPHKAAPLCLGVQKGLITGPEPYRYEVTREGEIISCPWHGWEFDLTSGRSVFNPHRVRVKNYRVTVEEDPTVQTFPVTVEADYIVVHTGRDPDSSPREG